MESYKSVFCVVVGFAGALLTTFLGGWTEGMSVLFWLMLIDYFLGLIVAGVFHKSNKTEDGGLSSAVGWKGIVKKACTILLVGFAYQMDRILNTDYLRDGLVLSFTVNEIISILENAGLMGLPIPKSIERSLEVLKNKDK